MRGLLRANGRPVAGPTPALTDNRAMFDQVQKEGATARTRYYERATQLIKRAILLLIYVCHLVSTDYMIADILTKATENATYTRMRDVIMNTNSGLVHQLGQAATVAYGNTARLITKLQSRLSA